MAYKATIALREGVGMYIAQYNVIAPSKCNDEVLRSVKEADLNDPCKRAVFKGLFVIGPLLRSTDSTVE